MFKQYQITSLKQHLIKGSSRVLKESGDAEITSLKKELFASKLEVNRLLAENAKLKKEKMILQNAAGEEKIFCNLSIQYQLE